MSASHVGSGGKLSRFLSISRAIAGQMDYEKILESFASEVQHLIPHDHLDIVMLANGDRDHICYEVGVHTSWSRSIETPLPTAGSPIRCVLWGEKPFLLADDAFVDPQFHFNGADDGPIFAAHLRSRIIVPLRVQGTIIGSLAISRSEPGAYAMNHVEIAQQAADLIAPYLYALARSEEASKAAVAESEANLREDLLRNGALRLTEGMERERIRLGMDLHDQTLADLSRLSRRIARLRRAEHVRGEELAVLEEELAACLHELRRIIEDTKPGVLQMFGFAEAVEAFSRRCVADTRPSIGIEVIDASGGAADQLAETIRTSAYRIVQEAVNNAVKHSGATRIRVDIQPLGDELLVEIADNGKGFTVKSGDSAGGIGNMRTRAALLSGQIQFSRPEKGSGTVVSLRLPFAPSTLGGSREPLPEQGMVAPRV